MQTVVRFGVFLCCLGVVFSAFGDLTVRESTERALAPATVTPPPLGGTSAVLNAVGLTEASLGAATSESFVFVNSLAQGGLVEVFDVTNIGAGAGSSFANPCTAIVPVGGTTPAPAATGVSYDSTNDVLVFGETDINQGIHFLHVTDTSGALIGSIDVSADIGSGQITGITYDFVNDSHWINDNVNDIYVEFTVDAGGASASATGASFSNPFGSPALGNGIMFHDDREIFYPPAGSVGAGAPDTAFGMNVAQDIIDGFEGNLQITGDTFLQGAAYHPVGSSGIPAMFIVGGSSQTLYEVDLPDDCAPKVLNLSCTLDPSGDVTGTYDNPGGAASVEVFENGTSVGTFAATGSWTVTPGTSATFLYTMEADGCEGGGSCLVNNLLPPPCDTGVDNVTHSNDTDTILDLNSVSCNAANVTADNQYFRTFNLGTFGVTLPIEVCRVRIGVESSVPGAAFNTQPLTCNLYADDDDDPATLAGGPLGSVTIGVPNIDSNFLCINFETSVEIPVGTSRLVCEISIPDATGTGSGAGHAFFIGSNDAGETDDSYLASVACGVPDAIPLSAIGFPTMHIVMQVFYNDPVCSGPPPMGDEFIRADSDGSGGFNALVDSLFSLAFGFQGGPPPPCMEAADADDDGTFNALVDVLFMLAHGFQGGPAPQAPYPTCGLDPNAPGLGCVPNPSCP